MTRTLIPTIASFLLLSTGAVGYAQESPPQQQPSPHQQLRPQDQQDPSADQGKPVTLKGCLTKGELEKQYIVADEASGKRISFTGWSTNLAGYVNQTVEVKGQIVEQGATRAFEAESVKSVASSCGK
jgi:hypothetical protein